MGKQCHESELIRYDYGLIFLWSDFSMTVEYVRILSLSAHGPPF